MIDAVLERLDKVRKSGKGYVACCPVHGDRNPSMSVTEKDGRVLCYCFSCGAKGPEVVEAVGLPISVLFEDEYVKTGLTKKDRDDLAMDRMVLKFAEQGHCKTYADYKRLKLARERVKSLEVLERQAS